MKLITLDCNGGMGRQVMFKNLKPDEPISKELQKKVKVMSNESNSPVIKTALSVPVVDFTMPPYSKPSSEKERQRVTDECHSVS